MTPALELVKRAPALKLVKRAQTAAVLYGVVIIYIVIQSHAALGADCLEKNTGYSGNPLGDGEETKYVVTSAALCQQKCQETPG